MTSCFAVKLELYHLTKPHFSSISCATALVLLVNCFALLDVLFSSIGISSSTHYPRSAEQSLWIFMLAHCASVAHLHRIYVMY